MFVPVTLIFAGGMTGDPLIVFCVLLSVRVEVECRLRCQKSDLRLKCEMMFDLLLQASLTTTCASHSDRCSTPRKEPCFMLYGAIR